jgi:2-amino-4-hydroxy-6-hydroxymethyldihydropteridine diphosphokinase
MQRVFLSIGSNIGNRLENCGTAIKEISSLARVVKVSSAYETEPVGNPDQADFINCAAEIETSLEPHELLVRLKGIEKKMGRGSGERWGPRVIDIDIIFYGDAVMDTEELQIPHISAHVRRFVLMPLCELEPGLRHPGCGVTVSELLDNLEEDKKVLKVGRPSTLFPQ